MDLSARCFHGTAGEVNDFIVAVFDGPVDMIRVVVVGGRLSAKVVNGRSSVGHFLGGRKGHC